MVVTKGEGGDREGVVTKGEGGDREGVVTKNGRAVEKSGVVTKAESRLEKWSFNIFLSSLGNLA